MADPRPGSQHPAALTRVGFNFLGYQGGVTKHISDSLLIDGGQGVPGLVQSTVVDQIVSITQAAYTALAGKDPSTLYLIIG